MILLANCQRSHKVQSLPLDFVPHGTIGPSSPIAKTKLAENIPNKINKLSNFFWKLVIGMLFRQKCYLIRRLVNRFFYGRFSRYY